jgi:molecular chaperone HtpG
MRKKQFKAESKKLLDLMINSIYTNREIFLRELISNCSDAIDKLYYRTLTNEVTGLSRDDFYIKVTPDKQARTITIEDNGCGMTEAELESNLGTIARSGSLDFKSDDENDSEDSKKAKEDIDIIGQFGVGFYSSFMVADTVSVVSLAYGEQQAHEWKSSGADGYTVSDCERPTHGTTVTLYIKPDTDTDKYSDFLEEYKIKELIKKYSDYIRYPIKMDITKTETTGEGDDQKTTETRELQTINSMTPIWKKKKSEVTPEEYNAFYKDNFYDYSEPLRVISSSTEGAATYNALLFIPSKAPFNYYSKDFEKGLKLYASGVMIMENCKDLLPDCFSFVRGLVDSQDLSLNISREMLQKDNQLRIIEKHLEKKIKNELMLMLRNERETYEKFWNTFGLQIKYGIYSSFGMNNDLLTDLLMFRSSFSDGLTTLDEYISRMKEDQKYIYYACGDNVENVSKLPQTERVADKGYEILYLVNELDEFTVKSIMNVQGKELRNISSDDLGFTDDDLKAQADLAQESSKDMFEFMKNTLGDEVETVKASERLKNYPVCLSSQGDISLEMEKVLSSQPNFNDVKAKRVLEVNVAHDVFKKLNDLWTAGDKEKLADYTKLLYDQSLLIAGLDVKDPAEFSSLICKLM